MGSSGTKLDVYLDFFFLKEIIKQFHISKKGSSPIDGTDTVFSTIQTILHLIFKNSLSDVRSLKNLERYPKDELKIIVAKIDQIKPKRIELHLSQKIPSIRNFFSLFFIDTSFDVIDDAEKSGFHFFNTNEESIKRFDRLTLHGQYSRLLGLIPAYGETNLPFDYSLLREFAPNANVIYIIDPYITTWDKNKFKRNIIELLRNLFISVNKSDKLKIELYALRKKSYEKENKSKNGAQFIGNRKKITASEIVKIIQKEFPCKNFEVKVYFINKYKIKQNRVSKDLFDLVDNYFHDRFILSNYLYCSSGRSFDYNMFDRATKNYSHLKETDFNIFSIAKEDVTKRAISQYSRILELKKFIQQPKFSSFFEVD